MDHTRKMNGKREQQGQNQGKEEKIFSISPKIATNFGFRKKHLA